MNLFIGLALIFVMVIVYDPPLWFSVPVGLLVGFLASELDRRR